MTIFEVCHVLLNSIILVFIVFGGLWLKNIVEQQLKSKDATIQTLQEAVRLKDSHIESLQGDTAPAIAKSYVTMREHANQISEDYQNLVTKYNELTSDKQLGIQLFSAQIPLSEAHGLNIARDILHKRVVELLFPEGNPNPLYQDLAICEAVLDAGIEMSKKSIKRSKIAGQIIYPIWKSLPEGERDKIVEDFSELLDDESADGNDAPTEHD